MAKRTVSKHECDFSFDLNVHWAVAWYIADVSPSKGWEVRGLAGRDFEDFWNYVTDTTKKSKKAITNNPSLKSEYGDFVDTCLNAFRKWGENENFLYETYIADRDFYFTIGSGRTGGTFLTKEISRAVDFPLDESIVLFSHDLMPDQSFTIGEGNNESEQPFFDFGWRKPSRYYNLVFQIIQYLEYIHREFPDCETIVKKSEFGKCMLVIDDIFNDRAKYPVTVRHPGACMKSWDERGFLESSDKKEKRENILSTWESVYKNIVRDGPPTGDITTVQFGEDMNTYLESLYESYDRDESPNTCKITEREYEDFWRSDVVDDAIERVHCSWRAHDLDFSKPNKII